MITPVNYEQTCKYIAAFFSITVAAVLAFFLKTIILRKSMRLSELCDGCLVYEAGKNILSIITTLEFQCCCGKGAKGTM